MTSFKTIDPPRSPLIAGSKMLLCLVLAAGSLGCSAPVLNPMKVEVALAEDLNNDQPLAVDIVVVCRERRRAEFQAMTAEVWFASREKYQAPDSEDPDLQVYSWEWVPGQTLPNGVTIDTHKACSIYVFANYANEADSKAVLKGKYPFKLQFGRDNLRTEVLNKKKKTRERTTRRSN